MSIWSDTTISRFAQEAENYIVSDVKCINKRISLQISAGQPIYLLPADVLSIRRVTWLGKKLDAVSSRTFTEYSITNPKFTFGAFNSHAFSDAFFISSSTTISNPIGTPYEYFFSGFGENCIRLMPCPNIDVNTNSGNLYSGEIIRDSVIVEYWAVADFDTTTQRMPHWIRRRLVKSYVLYKCMSQEGPGLDLIGSAYYKKIFETGLDRFRQSNQRLYYIKPQHLGTPTYSNRKLARPMLKYKYIGF